MRPGCCAPSSIALLAASGRGLNQCPCSWARLGTSLSADTSGLVSTADMDPVSEERRENDAGVFDNQFNQKQRLVRPCTPACTLFGSFWCTDLQLRRRTWCTTS